MKQEDCWKIHREVRAWPENGQQGSAQCEAVEAVCTTSVIHKLEEASCHGLLY